MALLPKQWGARVHGELQLCLCMCRSREAKLRELRNESTNNLAFTICGEEIISQCDLGRTSARQVRDALAPGRKRAKAQRNDVQKQVPGKAGSLASLRCSALLMTSLSLKAGHFNIQKASLTSIVTMRVRMLVFCCMCCRLCCRCCGRLPLTL